ncbi:MAG: type I-B CRISPR-associated endonuclease Cas1b [Anaeromicrobium sp.]|jgi:CRISPR-associated protein Cas1|uniref:type I-B CRISPR-associated endonuclease Cas1b n=1 Tax=Anaeromicrobium sp. TaxID=1929132 RepID=UPI0025D5385D|nr:type I-B CRISPR-associated endonuclease Cas1b [Anaeromicrobium sp.]MCT4594807.1 type I-B CRISPR-associated endonuclease Cas1b [Anaeromicrobium sp.]
MAESVRYIMSQGDLKRKDNSLCFRKNSKNHYIPIEGVKEIYCLNEVSLNTKLLDFLASNNIVLHFFNYYGSYSGTFFPREKYISGRITVRQGLKYTNERLVVAKSIVRGIGINISEVLYTYYKNGNKHIKGNIDFIRYELVNNLEKCNNIKEILAVEGSIWATFYDSIRLVLNEEFEFFKRVKRPPDNPINAMISLGNSILYTKTITQIYHTHLNQGISFLHEPSESRFSLALDLSEVFKPIIVFRTILTLANRKMIKVDKHFDKNLEYCLMNEEGKKIFIGELNKRLEDTFKHPKLKRKVSYNTAIKLDALKLVKFVLEDMPFIPFNIKEMM